LTVIPSPDRLLTRLSGLNLAGVLLGMGGGLGALFNFLIYANIRAYNRISVYLAFFCLFAVVLVLDRFLAWARSRNLSIPAYSLCAAGLVFGVWDECVKPMVQPYDQTALPFKNDQRFVRDIERQLGPDAAVFQLPAVRYPEASCQFHMVDYGHLRGYLHSKSLRWSFGLVPGREGLLWQQETAARAVPDMVRSLVLAGFRGLYIDRQGYADSAAALEYQLTAFLAVEPHVSADGLRSFFSLASYADRLHTSMTSESWTAARAAVLETPHALYLDGFHASEVFVDNPPHWCRPRGELLLINPSDRPRTVTLNMICRTDRPVPFPLTLTGLLPTETFPINNQPTLRTWTLSLPPGRHKIHLACAAPVDYIPARPGHVFFITDLSVTEVNSH
jgi:phosphoglycerol transferase